MKTGIEKLRKCLNLFNNCNESFNEKFTIDELIKLYNAYMNAEWDFRPDEWTEEQIQSCLKYNRTPEWDEDESGNVVPIL